MFTHDLSEKPVPTFPHHAWGYYGKSQQAAFTTTDLRIGVSGARFEVIGFARNLFKEKYLTEVSPAPEFGGSFVSQGPGRLFGGEVTVRF